MSEVPGEEMSQTDRLFELLISGRPVRTDEILDKVYGLEHSGIARIGARISDLKARGCEITSWPDPEKKSLWWYQLLRAPVEQAHKPKISMSSRELVAKELCKQSFIIGDQTKKTEKQLELFG